MRNAAPRTAIVTGGLGGIGAAISQRLREDGLRVLTVDQREPADIVLDIASPEEVSACKEFTAADVLVNCAGIVGPNGPLWEVEPEDWHRTLAVNLTGTYLMCRACVPGMRERRWGRIVNIASVAGKEGNPNLAAYSAAKAGVIGLTKSLGKELATDGVLVNAVAPALIATAMNAATAPDVLAYLLARIPMGRPGEPSEVAELVAWLASDRCSFSTGAIYDISGGRLTY